MAARAGLTLHLLIDTSPSVALQPAWGAVRAGLSTFLRDGAHAGLQVGIGYLGTSCTPSTYRSLAAPFGELPGAAAMLEASVPLPLTGKALVPALRGSLELDLEIAASDRTRDVALVLITDGVLDPLCGSTAPLAAADVAAAWAASPPVRTHVLGLGAGPSLLSPVDLLPLEPLDEVAAAGGTTRARRVAVELDSGADLARALDETARASLPCAIALAPGEAPRDLDVTWTPLGARAVTWPRVRSAAECGDRAAVHASDARPDRLELCPAACEAWSGAPEGRVEVVRGCASASSN
ncbi:MAG: hypothetical protein FJ104_08840 [Deltaproteobacteria bacterium]|nr:hypothetical protein [Deltaproteobacteria bacterium]